MIVLRFSPVLNFSACSAMRLRAFTRTRVCSALWNSFSKLKLISSLKLLICLGLRSSLFKYYLTDGIYRSPGDTHDISLGLDTCGRIVALLGRTRDVPACCADVLLLYFGDLIWSKLGPSMVVMRDSSAMLFLVTFCVRAFRSFLPVSLVGTLTAFGNFCFEMLGS